MKNGLLIWNVLLTIVAGYLLFATFRGKKTDTVKGHVVSNDTTGSSGFRIAYIEMDSVEVNYEMAKEATKAIKAKEQEITEALGREEKAYQNQLAVYRNQAQTMSPEEAEKASQTLMGMQERIKTSRDKQMVDYNDFAGRKNKELREEIREFLQEFNKDRKYAYILSYEPGMFYYADTIYSVTTEVISGLNVKYAKENSSKK